MPKADLRIVDANGSTRAVGSTNVDEVASLFETPTETKTNILGTEDLYPDPTIRTPSLNAALGLLGEAHQHLDRAIDAIRDRDAVSADDLTTRFLALLPELFCCRDLGDGFGLIVSSMFHAIKNLKGIPATEKQLLSLAFLVRFLRANIYCTVDTAIDTVDKLEDVGLSVEPPAIELIAERLMSE